MRRWRVKVFTDGGRVAEVRLMRLWHDTMRIEGVLVGRVDMIGDDAWEQLADAKARAKQMRREMIALERS